MPFLSKKSRRWAVPFVSTLAGLLAACSGPQEDPRINLCRHLAADLTGTSADDWQDDGHDIVRPEYAAVRVKGSGDGKAVCHYEYDAIEEDETHQLYPLTAYATLPYQLTVNGTDVPPDLMVKAISARQIEIADNFLQRLKEKSGVPRE